MGAALTAAVKQPLHVHSMLRSPGPPAYTSPLAQPHLSSTSPSSMRPAVLLKSFALKSSMRSPGRADRLQQQSHTTRKRRAQHHHTVRPAYTGKLCINRRKHADMLGHRHTRQVAAVLLPCAYNTAGRVCQLYRRQRNDAAAAALPLSPVEACVDRP